MLQKIIRVGNSYAVTIPKPIVEALEIPRESFVDVQEDLQKGRVILNFVREKRIVDEVVDHEVYKVAKRLLRRYLPAFKELAKR